MNHSAMNIAAADRATHVKIVLLALICSILIVWIAIAVHW